MGILTNPDIREIYQLLLTSLKQTKVEIESHSNHLFTPTDYFENPVTNTKILFDNGDNELKTMKLRHLGIVTEHKREGEKPHFVRTVVMAKKHDILKAHGPKRPIKMSDGLSPNLQSYKILLLSFYCLLYFFAVLLLPFF